MKIISLKTSPLRVKNIHAVLTDQRPLFPDVEEIRPRKEVEEDGCNEQDDRDLDLERKSAKN
jgi:hypothetical protein